MEMEIYYRSKVAVVRPNIRVRMETDPAPNGHVLRIETRGTIEDHLAYLQRIIESVQVEINIIYRDRDDAIADRIGVSRG